MESRQTQYLLAWNGSRSKLNLVLWAVFLLPTAAGKLCVRHIAQIRVDYSLKINLDVAQMVRHLILDSHVSLRSRVSTLLPQKEIVCPSWTRSEDVLLGQRPTTTVGIPRQISNAAYEQTDCQPNEA